jgi:hypothetical protein
MGGGGVRGRGGAVWAEEGVIPVTGMSWLVSDSGTTRLYRTIRVQGGRVFARETLVPEELVQDCAVWSSLRAEIIARAEEDVVLVARNQQLGRL